MIKIGLVYFSNTDVTGQLMHAVKTELECQQCCVIDFQISGDDIVKGRFQGEDLFMDLHTCDAMIFGSPTYMGSVSAQFKAFADATSDFWLEQKWAGKLAAGITSGSGLNGDQGSTLSYLSLLASQHGMIWVGLDAPFSDSVKNVNRLGCHLGVTACSTDGSVDERDVNTARYLAQRLCVLASKLCGDS